MGEPRSTELDRLEVEPFDIAIGRCAVVRDPSGNRLVMVDMSRGPLPTQSEA